MKRLYDSGNKTVLRKIKDNEFYVGGIAVWIREDYEIKEIDGVRYKAIEPTISGYKLDYDEEFSKLDLDNIKYDEDSYFHYINSDWTLLLIDIDFLGVEIKLYYPERLELANKLFEYDYSENSFVNAYVNLIMLSKEYEQGIIQGVFTEKKGYERKNNNSDSNIILRTGDYGYNNSMYLSIPVKHILLSDFSKSDNFIKHQISDIFGFDRKDYRRTRTIYDNSVPKAILDRKLTSRERVFAISKIFDRYIKVKRGSETNRRKIFI